MKKNKIYKIAFILILMTMALLILTTISNASSISVSTSKSTVSPGESFTVTVSVSNGAGRVSSSVSNGSGGKTEFLDNSSYSFTCTAGSSGTVSISASGVIGDYTTEQDETKYGSASVSIVQPAASSSSRNDSKDPVVGSTPAKTPTNTSKPTPKPEAEKEKKSSDATLDSLSIAEGILTPEFSKSVKEYTMEVESNVTELNITANLSDFKAAVTIEGNKDLKVGENIITIKVVAEDGTVGEYIVKVNRKRDVLALNSLKIFYTDENNEIQEIYLTPEFDGAILEYTVDNLSYIINNLNIEAIANVEGAIIEITGNENLQEGENIITIKITIPAENEGEEDEVVIYTIKVNKEAAPVLTLMGRIKNWFAGIGTAISTWYSNNQYIIVMSSLTLCSATMGGLTVYLIIEYKKYKLLLQKIADMTKWNRNNNFAIESDNATVESIETIENKEEDITKTKGRHF